ncbi:hypothetical protein D3C84_875850 [compost metagenome]
MVAIEPTALLLAQLFRQQAAGVDRAQRQGFEFKEVAKLAAPRFTVENKVLDSYPPLPWTVGARLDRGNHPDLHRCLRCRCRLIGNDLWSFMHIHEVTDAMSGTMTIIDLIGPDRRPGDSIEQR